MVIGYGNIYHEWKLRVFGMVSIRMARHQNG
jgi:hypothetical protein